MIRTSQLQLLRRKYAQKGLRLEQVNEVVTAQAINLSVLWRSDGEVGLQACCESHVLLTCHRPPNLIPNVIPADLTQSEACSLALVCMQQWTCCSSKHAFTGEDTHHSQAQNAERPTAQCSCRNQPPIGKTAACI